MEKDNLLKKVLEEPDFIKAPKFSNSINKYLAKTERLPHNGEIAKLLLIDSEEVERLYEESIVELRKAMCEDGEDR